MDDLGALLLTATPRQRDLVFAIRATVRATTPDATERVYLGWRSLGFGLGPTMADGFCGLGLYGDGTVRLSFGTGDDLPDPTGALVQTGKLHRIMRLSNADADTCRIIADLVRHAADHAAARRADRSAPTQPKRARSRR